MTDRVRLVGALRRLRRRALADAAAAWLLRFFAAAGAWIAACALIGRLWDAARSPLVLAAGASVALLACAGGWLVRGRPALPTVARVTDARMELRERLASALAAGDDAGTFGGLLEREAADAAMSVAPAAAFPLRAHRRRAAVAGVVAILAAVAVVLPRSTASASPQAAADSAALRDVAAQIDQVDKQVRAQAAQSPQDAARLAPLQSALDNALRDVQQAPSPTAALQRLSQLEDRLAKLQDPTTASRAAAAAAAGDALRSSPQTQTAAGDLAASRTAAAANDLRALGQAAASLTPAQRQSAAQALGQAAQSAGTDQHLSAALGQAAATLRRGDTAGAQGALSDAASALGDVGSAQSTAQQIAAAQAGVENARERAAAQADTDGRGASGSSTDTGGSGQGQGQSSGQPTGSGQGSGQGQGHGQGQGQGQGQGTGQGQGAGGQGGQGQGGGTGGSGTKPAQGSDSIFVGGQQGSGNDPPPANAAPGQQVPLANLPDVIGAFTHDALDSVGRTVVSPGDRDLVRQYFSSLGGAS